MISVTILFAVACNANAQLTEIRNREIALKKELKFDNWSIKKEQIRNGINLSTLKVQVLEDIKEVKPQKLFYISKNQNDSSFIQYQSKWVQSDSSFCEITISYMDSPIDAKNFIMNYYILGSSLPYEMLSKSKDVSAIVGDVSFFNGQLFIRDNIVVKLHAEGIIRNKSIEIAKEIDSLMLSQSISDSRRNTKPRLQKDIKGNISIIEP